MKYRTCIFQSIALYIRTRVPDFVNHFNYTDSIRPTMNTARISLSIFTKKEKKCITKPSSSIQHRSRSAVVIAHTIYIAILIYNCGLALQHGGVRSILHPLFDRRDKTQKSKSVPCPTLSPTRSRITRILICLPIYIYIHPHMDMCVEEGSSSSSSSTAEGSLAKWQCNPGQRDC